MEWEKGVWFVVLPGDHDLQLHDLGKSRNPTSVFRICDRATVMRDVMSVMDEGWLSIIRDPTGAPLGLWQSKKK